MIEREAGGLKMLGSVSRMQAVAWWVLLAGIMHTMGLHTPSMRMSSQPRLATGELRGDRLTPRWTAAAAGAAAGGQTTRLRGGGMSEDEEDSEDTRPTFKGTGTKLTEAAPAPASGSAAPAKEEEASGTAAASAANKGGEGDAAADTDQSAGGDAEAAEGGEGEEEETVVERPPLDPEMVRKMNKMLMEAALDGNEPLVDKALKNGANVNAFIRGPDR